MGKLGGLALIAALALTGCAAPAAGEPGPTSAPATADASQRIAPLLAAPAPSPSETLPPEFSDESARARYLAGVKKAVGAWRDGAIPSDEVLLEGAAQACQLFAEGQQYMEIGALAGDTDLLRANGVAVAVYASRNLCTQYNTDNL